MELQFGDIEAAIAELRRLVETQPAPRFLDDLAAALLAESAKDSRVMPAAEALEILADRPLSIEGAFNQGIAFEALGLMPDAEGAWREYLKRDPGSQWAEEVKQRLARRDFASSGRDEKSSRALEQELLERLLPDWAESTSAKGEASGRSILSSARESAEEYATRFDDPTLIGIVESAAEARGDDLRQLAERLLALRRARRAYAGDRSQECLREASSADPGRDSKFPGVHAFSALVAASCAYIGNDLPQAAARARGLLVELGGRGQDVPEISGQAAWLLALVEHSRQQPLEALHAYSKARASFEAAGDVARSGAIDGLLADLLEYLGRSEEAWAAIARAIRSQKPRSEREFQLFASLDELAASSGFPHVALRAAESAARAATELGRKPFAAEAMVLVGEARGRIGDRSGSLAALRGAVKSASQIEEHGVRERLQAVASLKLARAIAREDPAEAEGLLSSIGPEWETDLYVEAALARAATQRQRDEPGQAEATLTTALSRSRAELATIEDGRERDALFTRRAPIESDLLDLLLDAHRDTDALWLVDSWRSEIRSKAAAGGPSAMTAPSGWPGNLLQGDVVLYSYLSRPDELLVWRVDSSHTELTRRPIGSDELSRRVRSLQDRLLRDSRASGAPLDEWSRLLLPDPRERVVVVPDAVLYGVPFAALSSGPGALPIASDHEVVVSPSIRTWARRAAPAPDRPDNCVLAIEGATAGGESFPELPTLNGLDDEIDAVATSYGCSQRIGSPSELEHPRLRHPRVVHFAGHAVAGGAGAGYLLFREGEREIPLGVEALRAVDLSGAVVVLSSCSAADGRRSPRIGRDGLANAFLDSGAETVIASLWPVDDEGALEFSSMLHRELARGESPAAALQRTQRELIERGRPPRDWAGWRALGSDPKGN